ncbi:ANTAR domain-containing protein [Brenneria goodwinii]|uniref:ANTAR domain-containing response regulator n=1 Tax=Brenneria goodwinii TaxID=1109412 RepID=UPI000EF225BB|nr:ANTAR domain-containing protein [Brenneria goodwinii]MCG8158048.1 ANTAR domain-containing protein [Brenneria goodwinii]MCG8161304.1 ANTAR domain-containing protein [Brenneria goodwinii]MCG8168002.1 ANTAR domain-containing protein [Brenneria goodwinii]MCG8172747.1 ANTAR domain-containing protein [Brenneria goodwinii]MCG8177414.1 ANTAR domain-containing protein [Brenneria goodwinii]
MRRNDSRNSTTALLLSRGIRCVVLHPNDEDGETLTRHLRRMGFKVKAFWPIPEQLPADTDLIFFAPQSDQPEPDVPWLDHARHALISVIAYENPTFIDQALNMGAGATITTPIRASGLLSSMVLALHHRQQRRQMMERIERLEKKMLGIRQVSEAKAILMRMHGISEERAYEILRHQAMDKRITVEEMSSVLIQANDVFSLTAPVKKLSE